MRFDLRSPLSRTSASSRKWMWLFIGVALLVYLPGLWWGLPAGMAGRDKPWGTDELGAVGAINETYGLLAARNPTFNPQYPMLQYFTQAAFVAPYYIGLYLTGHLSYPAPVFPYGLDHPKAELGMLTMFARLSSLLLAAGVVALAYRTGEVLRNHRVGLLMAMCVLLLYPMFYYARTSNVDMGALFWTALGLLVFAETLTSRATMAHGLWLGLTAAMAAAAKDASYAVFVPIGAIFLVRHVQEMRQRGATWMQACRVPAAALVMAIAAYAVASGLVFRPSRFMSHVRFITTHNGEETTNYFRNPATFAGYMSVAREFLVNLSDGMGLPMLVAAFAGIAYWIGRRSGLLLLWLIPALGIPVLVLLPVRFVMLRFLLITVYMLALPAADVLAREVERPSLGRGMAWLTVALVLGFSAVRGGDLTYQMLNDSRYAGTAWFQGVARPGDRVGHMVPARNLPYLPDGVRTMMIQPASFTSLPDDSRPEFIISIPLSDTEIVHEPGLPDATFQQLVDGTMGYRQVALLQGRTLFSHRPARYLNPPLRIFIREDLMSRLAGR